MTLLFFNVPFILRANKSVSSSANDEGFFVCDYGSVVLDTETKTLKIIEQENDDVKLTILLGQVTLIECRPFKSKGRRFKGGKICLHGIFDRGVEERVTIKMDTAIFRHFAAVLHGVVGE